MVESFLTYESCESYEQQELNEALLNAAARGYDGVVLVLRDGGADPGAVIRRRHSDENKRMSIQTPLLAATTCGNESVVNLLLDWNVDLEFKNGYGRSALSVAVLDGHEEIVQLLLAKGADTNSQDELGRTAFHWAANRYDKTLYLLSDYDPNGPTQRDFYGRTALHLASTQGNLRVVRALIVMRSTDCDIRDNFGRTARCDAKRRGHHDIIKALQNPVERLTDEISAVQITCPQAWTGVVCDVCMGFILSDETWYHCSSCRDGDHDTCDWCYQIGARCSNREHELEQRSELPTN